MGGINCDCGCGSPISDLALVTLDLQFRYGGRCWLATQAEPSVPVHIAARVAPPAVWAPMPAAPGTRGTSAIT